MPELFDPSAFIQAERSQTVAPPSYSFSPEFEAPKQPEISQSPAMQRDTLATIATLARGAGENLPWKGELESWAASKCPSFIQPAVWEKITLTALSVSLTWGAKAIEHGWSSLDLFGCYRRPQYRRLDYNGLVATTAGLLTPVQITAVHPSHADITDPHGAVMRFYRRDKPGSVHLWEAYRMPGGP